MDIADATTSPLPAVLQEPLLLIIDAQEQRLAWVVRLLTFAHYRAYAVKTTQEALDWYAQHRIAPRMLLIGQITHYDHFVIRRFIERLTLQNNRSVSVLFLAQYLTGKAVPSSLFSGCFALLEAIWQVMLHQKR